MDRHPIFIGGTAKTRAVPNGLINDLIDASGEEYGFTFKVPKTGSITKVGFVIGSVTTSDTLRVGLYTLSGIEPSTTAYGGMVAGDISSLTAGTKEVTLSTPATATAGDNVALRIFYPSYVAGNITISTFNAGANALMPGVNTKIGGAWGTTNANSRSPLMYLVYSGDVVYSVAGADAFETITSVSVGLNTTPDEVGFKFIAPVACELVGAVFLTQSNGSKTLTVYDSSDSVLYSTSFSNSNFSESGTGLECSIAIDPLTLTAGQTYRVTMKQTTATTDLYLYVEYGNANAKATLGGTDIIWTERTDAGAWTDRSLRLPAGGVLLSGLTSGGGLMRHPGMSGGVVG